VTDLNAAGDLIVRHENNEVSHQWNARDPLMIKWVAFTRGCELKLEYSGTEPRFVLFYDLFVEDRFDVDSKFTHLGIETGKSAFQRQLMAMLEDTMRSMDGGYSNVDSLPAR